MRKLAHPGYDCTHLALAGFCVVFGQEGEEWMPDIVDAVEWTATKYGHQN